jgi:hypothetical protein
MYILSSLQPFFLGKNSLKCEIKNKNIFEIFNHNIFKRNLGKFFQIFTQGFKHLHLDLSFIWLNIPRDDCHISYIKKKMQENTPICPDQKLGFTRMLVQMQLQHKSIKILKLNQIN